MSDVVDMRDAFFDQLYQYISQDKSVMILTADHGAFGLKKIEKDFPSQYLNVGIAEQAMISVAAGLAKCGKKVYVYAINNFVSLRVLEQVNIDICAMGLDVNIVGVGAGFTYSTDGPTHQGLQDLSAMSCIPKLNIYNVSDAESTKEVAKSSYEEKGPKYIRIEKGRVDSVYSDEENISNKCNILSNSSDKIGIISTGFMTHVCLDVVNGLKDSGTNVSLLDIIRVKPLEERSIVEYAKGKNIIVVEENIKSGGIGEKIGCILKENNHTNKFKIVSLQDDFHFEFNDREKIHKKLKIGRDDIEAAILKMGVI